MATTTEPQASKRTAPSLAFTVSREQLVEALARVTLVAPARSTLPILGNILVSANRAGLVFTCTDLDTMIQTGIAADVDVEGMITLPARKLLEIAKNLPPSPVKLSADGSTAKLTCGGSRFTLHTMPADEFPSSPAGGAGMGSVSMGELEEHIARTRYAVSTEESRPILNGVLVEPLDDGFRFVATNGHRLARSGDPDADPIEGLIVPAKVFDHLGKLFGNGERLILARSTGHLEIKGERTQLTTRLIEGPYPDYVQVIPRESTRSATIDRMALMNAVKRVATLAPTQTHSTRLTFTAGKVALDAQSADVGQAHDVLPCNYEGAGRFEIGMNAAYLLAALERQPTDEVRLAMTTNESAVVIEPVPQPDVPYLTLLMPIRIVEQSGAEAEE